MSRGHGKRLTNCLVRELRRKVAFSKPPLLSCYFSSTFCIGACLCHSARSVSKTCFSWLCLQKHSVKNSLKIVSSCWIRSHNETTYLGVLTIVLNLGFFVLIHSSFSDLAAIQDFGFHSYIFTTRIRWRFHHHSLFGHFDCRTFASCCGHFYLSLHHFRW